MEKIEYGNLRSYVFGFVLSLLITLLAYFLVTKDLLARPFLDAAVAFLTLGQALLQLVLFLDLLKGEKPRWNLIVFLFMLLVAVIIVFGSVWIMYNLSYNLK